MRQMRPRALPFASTPFRVLMAHFAKRLFADEQEEATETMSLGIGAVLALLASPGAFASIFLLDKYSTLLQWLRGNLHFNPYKASIADEYFFVVLSMTITGLVMVLRWNRLFPDRRDFANLAALPIAIRNIFIANFAALLGLGLLFALDVNAVSSFLFPVFVTISDGSFSAFLRIAIAHSAAVFSASLFSFFGVFALVGVLMLVLPQRLFKPVSIFIRMLLVVALLTEFFSNLFFQLLAGRLPNQSQIYARWLPSFWFLGIYENAAGLAKPAMARLGHEALVALFMLVLIAIAAYSLCYRRHFLRMAESLEVIGNPRRRFRLHIPERLERLFFRSPFEHACNSFAVKVLLRSERHMMFFGGYLGVGLVLVAQAAVDSAAAGRGTPVPSTEILMIPLLIAFFLMSGLRFAFDMPAALKANWVYRSTLERPKPVARSVAKRLLLSLVLPWEVLLVGPITAYSFGWRIAFMHAGTVVALTVLSVDLMVLRCRRIPFTCNVQPELKEILTRILGTVFAVIAGIPLVGILEHWMLLQPRRFIAGAVVMTIAWVCARRYGREPLAAAESLAFEERASSGFELLKLV